MKYNRQLLKEKINIVDFISRYVKLKKGGKNFVGLCPFHAEKTPSFSVSEEKQIFHCFGCGAGGDVVEFLSRYLKTEFYETVAALEKETGLVLLERDPEYLKRRMLADSIIGINKHALAFFNHVLFKTDKGTEALKYISDRKMSLETVRKFAIGYGGAEWDRLAKYLERKGVSKAEIEKSGLVICGATGNRDFFRQRLIFPIINQRNEVIGFGGRAMDGSLPKYINSPENPVFSKRKNLYGINVAIEQIRRSESVFIVEGYMDCIMMHQAGYGNVIATLGTAITEEQVKYLKGICAHFNLVYDGDKAGVQAALRGAEVFLNQGVSPRIVLLPDGEDPDSLISAGRKDALDSAIGEAKNAVDFIINFYKMIHSLQSSDGVRNFLHAITKHVRNIDNPLERELLQREISKTVGIPWEKIGDQLAVAVTAGGAGIVQREDDSAAEIVLGFLIHNPGRSAAVGGDVVDQFTPEQREIYDALRSGDGDERFSAPARQLFDRLHFQGEGNYSDYEKAFLDSATYLKRKWIRKEKEDIDRRIREFESATAPDYAEIYKLQEHKRQLTIKESELQKRSPHP